MLKKTDILYFIHIPKTAGTSLIPILDKHFHEAEIFPAQLWRELVHIPQKDISKYRFFRGHFGGNGLNPFLPAPPLSITMLRDPLSLAFSTYEFILREPNTRVHEIVKSRQMTFSDFIDHPKTRPKISNKQVNNLSFDLAHNPDVGPIFLSSASLVAVDKWIKNRRIRLSAKDRLERAKLKIKNCVFFGITERFDESMLLLAYTFGWPPIGEVQKLRVSQTAGYRAQIPPRIIDRVKECNRLDLELYSYARELFENRLSQMKRDLTKFAEKKGIAGLLRDPAAYREVLDHYYQDICRQQEKPRAKRICYDFSQPLFGSGWHRREVAPTDHTLFRWTGPGSYSFLDLNISKERDLRITIHILNAVDAELLDGFRIKVNGHLINLNILDGFGTPVRTLQGVIPRKYLRSGQPFVRIALETEKTLAPIEIDPLNQDNRYVGIAVNWIDLRPADELPPGAKPDISLKTCQPVAENRFHSIFACLALTARYYISRIPLMNMLFGRINKFRHQKSDNCKLEQ